LSILITRVLYSDYIGPARLRLNLPELAPELKRVLTPLLCIMNSTNFNLGQSLMVSKF